MIYEFNNIKDYLKSEFESRIRKNHRYSLRAFAGVLGVHAAELSQVFSGKRNLSFASAIAVCKGLDLNQDESKHLMSLLQSAKAKKLGLELVINESNSVKNLTHEMFSKVGQWYHFAIISLADTKNFIWNAKHISKRLGISIAEATLAMKELEDSGLVETYIKRGRVKSVQIKVSSEIPSQVIRSYHRQMLEKAALSLDEVAIDQREFQSVGICTDKKNIPMIKKEIESFMNKIMNQYHQQDQAEHVYQTQIAMFRLTKENL